MKISFRKVSEDDFPFLRKVYRSTREEELSQANMSEEDKSRFIEFQFNAQHTHYSQAYKDAEFNLILLDDKPVGRLYIWRTETQIRIMDIALLPDFQGKGVGTRILQSIIQESEKSGKKGTIHVEYFNPALRLYERLGFKKVDDSGIYFYMERLPKTVIANKFGL
ncbi:MAG: GNAT family N-acetyltransferase [Bacteroidota bacterium]|nr:GNAT family N-acetyltransferase [Bacteroidota bacterium]